MPASHADIDTGAPERYADGLRTRLGGEPTGGTDDSTVIETDAGTTRVATAPSLLSVKLEAADEPALSQLQERVTRELAELDEAGELVVEWHRLDT